MLRVLQNGRGVARLLSTPSLESDILVGRIAEKIRSNPVRPEYGPGSRDSSSTAEAIALRERYSSARGRHIARSAVAATEAIVRKNHEMIRQIDEESRKRIGARGARQMALRSGSSRDTTEGQRAYRLRHQSRLSHLSTQGLLARLPAETTEGDDAIRERRVHHGRSDEEIVMGLVEAQRSRAAERLAALESLGASRFVDLVHRSRLTGAELAEFAEGVKSGDPVATAVCPEMPEGAFDDLVRRLSTNDFPHAGRAVSKTAPGNRVSWAGAVRAEFPHTIRCVSLDSMTASDHDYSRHAASRAVVSFPLSGLGLSAAAAGRFLELVGPRYNQRTGACKFAVLRFRDRAENLTHVFWQIRECVIEAHKADDGGGDGARSRPVEELFPDGDPSPRLAVDTRREQEDAIRAFIGDEAYTEVDPHPYPAPAIDGVQPVPALGTAREIMEQRRIRFNVEERAPEEDEGARQEDIDGSDTEDDERF